ncbi:hypothetical protein COX75_02270, partial [bacterium (Candidatus Gribaldobacteria) CG_4_10_14_0_2_um_filter_33_15]
INLFSLNLFEIPTPNQTVTTAKNKIAKIPKTNFKFLNCKSLKSILNNSFIFLTNSRPFDYFTNSKYLGQIFFLIIAINFISQSSP